MVEVIIPPVSLADRVVKDSGPDLRTIIADVEAGIETMKQDYDAELAADLAVLDGALAEFKATSGEVRADAAAALYRAAHDMRGLAGSFGYPLLTGIASSLCAFIDRTDDDLAPHIQVVELHLGAMHAVVANKVTGGGGKQGRALLESISALVTKALGDEGRIQQSPAP